MDASRSGEGRTHRAEGGDMKIETAEDAVDAYKSLGDWQYADREAVWKWMFKQGQIAEREACAKVCEELRVPHGNGDPDGDECAAAIRARSNQ